MLTRAYSLLNVKAVDTERRVFTGMATTPTPDRVDDVMEPKGARFKNPLTLLLFHDSKQPVGTVKFGRPSDEGIPFEASIPDVKEPGRLKDRVDEAWHSVKYGVIRGVSIGFKAMTDGYEVLKSGGLRFTDYEVLELSLVPIPANAEATITTIKSIDAEHLAATGTEGAPVSTTPGASGSRVVKTHSKAPMKKTISEQIKDFEATRETKQARMTEIMDAAGKTGETLSAEAAEEYDGLEADVTSINTHLTRLARLEETQKAAAVPVRGATPAAAAEARGGRVITVTDNLPPGIEFARLAICKALQASTGVSPLSIAEERYPDNPRIHQVLKAAINAGTTTHSTWAGSLVYANNMASEFVEFLRPQTIIGKFGTGVIPSLRRVPFNIRYNTQTSGGVGYWVGEGNSKPVTKYDFSAATLTWTKVAAISVITEELARFSSPSAEQLVRDGLAETLIERLDRDFVDPGLAAVNGVNPASITNGVSAQTSAGTSADNARTDLAALFATFVEANVNPASMVLIMPNTLALALSFMVNDLGNPEFPGLTMSGGTIKGVPVITSQYATDYSSGGGNLVILLNANDIFLADEGQVTVDASREASLQMLDNPTGSSSSATAVSVVSMFQTNSIALRAERFIHWKKRRTSAVAYMDDVNWGSVGSPPEPDLA
jgi:HK97 family phage major capsid protein/HK97 family phage prohead protease